MLYWNTVNNLLKDTLITLMESRELQEFRLIGGTGILPDSPMTGILHSFAISAIPIGPLPKKVCSSNLPSPIVTNSASDVEE